MNRNDDNRFDDELLAKAKRLSAPIMPERDLWPEIERAITSPARPQRSLWNTVWAQAAAVVVLVGGSSGLTYMTMNDGNDPTVPAVAETPVFVFEQASASFGSQYTLGPDYQDARRGLVSKLDERLVSLSPEARAEVMTNMETIRKAIDDINHALAAEPDNVLLQELLINTYRDELSVMMQVDDIMSAAMRRGDI
jgi:hypothetical protein